MRRDRQISVQRGVPAVASGVKCVALHITGVRRADVHERTDFFPCFLPLDPAQCLVGGGVGIHFTVVLADRHMNTGIGG